MDYLTEQWSQAWLDPMPRSAAEIRDALDRPDCAAKGLGAHFMTGYGAKLTEGPVTWYMGYCSRCVRAMLMQINDDAFSVKWWPFYDQEKE